MSAFGDRPIVFDNQFVFEVSRKMYPLVRDATNRIAQEFEKYMLAHVPQEEKDAVDDLFRVESPVAVWLQ